MSLFSHPETKLLSQFPVDFKVDFTSKCMLETDVTIYCKLSYLVLQQSRLVKLLMYYPDKN